MAGQTMRFTVTSAALEAALAPSSHSFSSTRSRTWVPAREPAFGQAAAGRGAGAPGNPGWGAAAPPLAARACPAARISLGVFSGNAANSRSAGERNSTSNILGLTDLERGGALRKSH